MKKYIKQILIALLSLLFVIVLNFILPRIMSGDPIYYLLGFYEDVGMSQELYDYYYHALHLDENYFVQFDYYLKSLFDGSFGYSYQHNLTVSELLDTRIMNTIQITLPAIVISSLLSLVLGLLSANYKNKPIDKILTGTNIILDAIPAFVTGMILLIVLAFKTNLFPYKGLNSASSDNIFLDRLWHLFLPILTLVIAQAPSKYIMVRNNASKLIDEKYVEYAQIQGLSRIKIEYSYLFKNSFQPFITMVAISIGTSFGGSVIIENIFSINGMGKLISDAITTLNYPVLQGCLYITSLFTVIALIISDILCIVFDPKIRRKQNEK